ncbi:hypothetical protein [Parvularcula sp. IMCC14364]|uniref:hypothetical protein n=1 Tax=Parvularcula sp. IMCC14364 TaxID=3067902 RepID=UPI002740F32B|nr:hypothetical protein [Parvularcula sp. IMCC14364]
MSWNLFIGGGIILLGLFNLWMTFAQPSFFDQLEKMKQAYGEVPGLIGHLVIYAALPVIGGLALIVSGLLFG